MKLKDLIKELEEKEEYKNFKSQNPDSFFTAAFLILDLKERCEQIQLDYFMPKTKQIAAFSFPFQEPKIYDEIISVKSGKTTPKKIFEMLKQKTELKIDIDDLESRCKEVIKENNSAIVPTKIIAILKDNVWNLTAMDDILGIARIKIEASTCELKDFSKGGLMDIMGIKKK